MPWLYCQPLSNPPLSDPVALFVLLLLAVDTLSEAFAHITDTFSAHRLTFSVAFINTLEFIAFHLCYLQTKNKAPVYSRIEYRLTLEPLLVVLHAFYVVIVRGQGLRASTYTLYILNLNISLLYGYIIKHNKITLSSVIYPIAHSQHVANTFATNNIIYSFLFFTILYFTFVRVNTHLLGVNQ